MTSRQDKWVQVRQAELLKYVNGVEMLSKDHTQLQQDFNDAKQIAGMIDRTWKERLDQLMDVIIDIHPSVNVQYRNGMMAAYNIMQGIEE
jgi:short-subunit dehydrogenase involved in D-alanine esterification of teichoic acids